MMHGFHLDPHAVLGLTPGASAQDIREAYRNKTKKHHPDHGGDEWAFRVVVRAYEILSAMPPAPASAQPQAAAQQPEPGARAAGGAERVRPGIHDKVADPRRIVDVEILWLRYPVADLFELVAEDAEDRNLSGTVNIIWPSATAAGLTTQPSDAAEVLRRLDDVFDDMRTKTRVVSSRCQRDAGRFSGWLSYPSGQRAWDSFKVLHDLLKARGLGVRQWTRDLVVPRD
jgi:hypothetical protein